VSLNESAPEELYVDNLNRLDGALFVSSTRFSFTAFPRLCSPLSDMEDEIGAKILEGMSTNLAIGRRGRIRYQASAAPGSICCVEFGFAQVVQSSLKILERHARTFYWGCRDRLGH